MAIVPTIGGREVLHPGDAFGAVMEQSTPVDFWQRANSYTCPLGAEPGVAWLLMKRRDLDALDPTAFHELKWTEEGIEKGKAFKRTLTIPSLLIVKSYTINLALAGDKKAARLVEFRDRRHLFRMSSINKQYNVRIPAPSTTSGADRYYQESLLASNGSFVLWTWQTILDDLFDQLPDPGELQAVIGNPVLAFSPEEPPEGFRFIGENAWDAIDVVLKKIHGAAQYDPVTDAVNEYIDTAASQPGFLETVDGLSHRLMYDYDADDPTRDYTLAKFPETVRVFFNRRELYHGIEKDTVQIGNWEMEPVVSKDFATGITGVHSGSVLRVWDDLLAEFDSGGVNFNSGALQVRANAVGGNIKNTFTFDRMRRMFSGLVFESPPIEGMEELGPGPFVTGSQVSEITWRDYGDETGLVTEIKHLSKHDEVFGELDGASINEHLRPPDLARATHPLWPRLSQPVRVDDGSSPGATGEILSPNSDGLFPGFVRRWANGAWTDLDACWIRPVDLQGDREDRVGTLRQLDTLIGRLSGIETSGGSTRPVYLCREGSGAAKGAPIRTVWGSTLAPIQHTDGFYYQDRNNLPDTDWALMDGFSNSLVRGGSGVTMWKRPRPGVADVDGDTYFVRARDSATDADDTPGGRTVPFGDPNVDLIQLNDHNDHAHEILDLCEQLADLTGGGDVKLCAWDQVGGVCATECTSGVKLTGDCGSAAELGVLEHTFVNGQAPTVIEFEVTPPNKQWHWFERIAEIGAMGSTPFAPMSPPVSQPMVPLPPEPITAGASLFREDDGSPLPP